MFIAYSAKEGRELDAKDARNVNEIYCCLNRKCPAEFRLRSVNGQRTVHFANEKGLAGHLPGCRYAEDGKYADRSDLIKSSVTDIINGARSREASTDEQHYSQHSNGDGPVYIRTPKELFQFCCYNGGHTLYRDGLTVDDIYLCSENLFKGKRFLGISGPHLVSGTTERVFVNEGILCIAVEKVSSTGKKITLHATVRTSSSNVKKVSEYLERTYNRPSEAACPLAVLGNWTTAAAYNTECSVDRPSLIILSRYST